MPLAGRIACPGCGQVIAVDMERGMTECGGVGEGICNLTAYADDRFEYGHEQARELWNEATGFAPLPSDRQCDLILAAHNDALARAFHR